MEYSLNTARENVGQLGRLTLVFSGLLLGTHFCSWAAYSFVEWVSASNDLYVWSLPLSNLSTAGASVAFLVSIAKQSLLSIRKYLSFIVKGEKFDFYKESLSILLSLFLLFLTCFSYQGKGVSVQIDPSMSKPVEWDVLYLHKKDFSSDELAIFPLLFDNAKLGEDGKIVGGISIETSHKLLINKLLDGLAPCAQPDSQSVVEISVEGFSSSRVFSDTDGNSLNDSDTLNAETAYLRAYNTQSEIDKFIELNYPNHKFIFSPLDRNDYTASRVPPFVDQNKRLVGSDEQEILNRSVFIKLVRVGECQRGVPGHI